jgi:hypothetical protein
MFKLNFSLYNLCFSENGQLHMGTHIGIHLDAKMFTCVDFPSYEGKR